MARWITEERVTELAKMGRLRDASGKVVDTSKLGNVEFITSLSGSGVGPAVVRGERPDLPRLDSCREVGSQSGPLTLQCREGGAVNQPAHVREQPRALPSSAAPSKFRNVKTDGYASKKEAARASQLRLMQEAGQIRNLREQLEYELIPRQEGERACFYRADFVYDEFGADGWRQVVEDTKGMRTADYVIKRKLMLHVHGIRIRET